MTRLRILALEPYYGGSHRAVLDGLVRTVDAEWTLLTLPARKWKWRMRGAAITMAAEASRLAEKRAVEGDDRPPFDLIFASTFLNLAEFRGMATRALAAMPAIVYFHENQLVYPNRHAAEWDFQFPLTNITSALSAETCVFNTEWNLSAFVDAVPPFLREFPDNHPQGVPERIRSKSLVLAPPFDSSAFDAQPPSRGPVPRIVWPHRWEHDKNPEEFFSAVSRLAEEGLHFEVAVAGQSFRDIPPAILDAEQTLGSRLVHLGEPRSREDSARLLASSDVAVSTAVNEFFGLAMIEASYAGCRPLVPDRLAYTELYPSEYRYRTTDELQRSLRECIVNRPEPFTAKALAEGFTFEALAAEYASLFECVASRRAREGAW